MTAIRCLEPDGQAAGASPAAVRERARQRTAPRLVCVVCGAVVTTRADAITVDGRHDHRCVNPHGVIYDIGCFGAAPGAAATGAPESYFSWFRGFAWRIALCRRCGAHLGWAFDPVGGEGGPFWGLIVDALREQGEAPTR